MAPLSTVSSGRDKTRTKNILGTGMQTPTWWLDAVVCRCNNAGGEVVVLVNAKCRVQSPIMNGDGTMGNRRHVLVMVTVVVEGNLPGVMVAIVAGQLSEGLTGD